MYYIPYVYFGVEYSSTAAEHRPLTWCVCGYLRNPSDRNEARNGFGGTNPEALIQRICIERIVANRREDEVKSD